jgi:hypothetical protein
VQQQNSAGNAAAHASGNYPNDQENLKSYISDLKKAAVGNKKGRGNASNQRGTNGVLVSSRKFNQIL